MGLLIACYLGRQSFVPAPSSEHKAKEQFLAPAVAGLAAAAQFPGMAHAVAQKWEYKEPPNEVTGTEWFWLIFFVSVHLAGIADFYAKKTMVDLRCQLTLSAA